MQNGSRRSMITREAALKVVVFYALIGSLWIIATDGIVFLDGGVDGSTTVVSMSKGLLYVAVTAILLYVFMRHWIRLSHRASHELNERLAQFAKFGEDIVLLFDKNGHVIDANDRAVEAYGYPPKTLMKLTARDLRCDGDTTVKDWQIVVASDRVRFETEHRRADGSTFPVEVAARRIDFDDGFVVQSIVRDITQHKNYERKILHLKDVYAALSQTNQCIVRVADRDELYRTICDIAIKFGHFRMAWIGLINPETKFIEPVMWAGEGSDVLEGLQVSANPASPFSTGVVGQAVITGQSQVVNDFLAWQGTNPWFGLARDYTFRAAGAFPLFNGGKPIGALTLYSEEVGFFSPELINLLVEMAMDISFALDRIDADAERKRLAERLAVSNARIGGIIEGTPDIIATVDHELRYMLCNQAYQDTFLRIFRVPVEPGQHLKDAMVHEPDWFREFEARWHRALAGEHLQVEWSVGQGDSTVSYESHYGPLMDGNGHIFGAFHIGRDTTLRTKMEYELRKLSTAVEQSPVTVVITDADGTIQYVNPAFSVGSGYSAAEAIGQNPRILKSGLMPQEDYEKLWRCIKRGDPWAGLFHNKRKDGTLFWEEAVIAPVRSATGEITNFIGVKQDVTKRREAEENAAFLTHHDALTKLPNRLLGRDRLERALVAADRSRTKSAILIVNLDHFKRVNDSLGHDVGDVLLKTLTERLKGCIRETDTLSRQGGDEFMVVLSAVDDSEAINRIAAQILERVTAPFAIKGFELSVTVSIGIAVYPDDGLNVETLLRQADVAMSQAKEAGRNTYRFFAEKMNEEANEYLQILSGLRKALQRNEFVLHYQPQFDLTENSITGTEALIRWQEPTIGLVPPNRFISIAEESGLIVEIGNWVLREACRQAAEWKALTGRDVVVAVNLSAVQFKRGDLYDSVRHALEEAHLSPSCLELELTESILIRDTENVVATVVQLKALGVKLSIDDFGTGYSSLAYLRLLKLDTLKIDQSFVNGIATDRNKETIVKAIVQMAQGLGLKTIAEGVEDWDTLQLIRRHGCDVVQGYFFARPMPASEFLSFLMRPAPTLPVD